MASRAVLARGSRPDEQHPHRHNAATCRRARGCTRRPTAAEALPTPTRRRNELPQPPARTAHARPRNSGALAGLPLRSPPGKGLPRSSPLLLPGRWSAPELPAERGVPRSSPLLLPGRGSASEFAARRGLPRSSPLLPARRHRRALDPAHNSRTRRRRPASLDAGGEGPRTLAAHRDAEQNLSQPDTNKYVQSLLLVLLM